MRSILVASVAFALVLLVPMSGVAGATAAVIREGQTPIPVWHVASSSSTNWGGYVVKSTAKSVTDVKASWIVPKVQGTCPAKFEAASLWVGIDGYGSGTVEQTGTDSDCVSGAAQYYAWFEFYPHPSHNIATLKITPGDTMFAEVSFSKGNFTTTLRDVTTGHSFSAKSAMKAQRLSAEWIVEAPYSGGTLPLTNFGSALFGFDNTSVNQTCQATVGANTGAMGSFSGLISITMVNNAGTKNKAVPTTVSSDNTSFGVTWKSAGP